MGQRWRDDLAFLTEGAGEKMDVMVSGGVRGHRHPRRQRLVIGMGVDEQEPRPAGSALGRWMTAHRTDTVARSTVPPSAWLSM